MPNTEESIQETGGIPEIEVELEVAGMTMYPTDKTLNIRDQAADAKAVGDEFANVNVDIGNILARTGSDIPITSGSSDTIADAVSAAGSRKASDIAMSSSDSTKVKAHIDALETNTVEMTDDEIEDIIEEVFGGES